MNDIEKRIVENYSALLNGLSPDGKKELIEILSKPQDAGHLDKEAEFYQSYGAFGSEKPAEEIIAELRSA